METRIVILKLFLAASIIASLVLLTMKYTGYLDISLFYAISFAFIPNVSAFLINISKMLFNRFEVFINTVLNILLF